MMSMGRNIWLGLMASLAAVTAAIVPASAQQPKPNILVIMADDIGYWSTRSDRSDSVASNDPSKISELNSGPEQDHCNDDIPILISAHNSDDRRGQHD
jgi:hypothetical protein